jgi:hypothetical protein
MKCRQYGRTGNSGCDLNQPVPNQSITAAHFRKMTCKLRARFPGLFDRPNAMPRFVYQAEMAFPSRGEGRRGDCHLVATVLVLGAVIPPTAQEAPRLIAANLVHLMLVDRQKDAAIAYILSLRTDR